MVNNTNRDHSTLTRQRGRSKGAGMPEAERLYEANAINDWRTDGDLISQQTMAVAVGISVSTSSRWCRGEAVPTLAQARQLEQIRPGLVRRLFPEAFRKGA